ncbi:MAG TPA: 4Fe-4S dicluster domain-containing protein [Candidatus Krumholzibacteriaceae bacterium]|nr:4Fe-4S dicluster domain-containing protein [Candidatus Krumholzibacteriaceae bacterium]
MRIKLKFDENEKKFVDRVSELSGENIYSCYQCGRCSAGCPFAFEMDILPNQLIRLVQMGLEEELLGSKALFLCASCFTCQARCPKGINIASIAEAARYLIEPKGKDYFGPEEVPDELADELPQQALVSVFRKFSK